ncbi:hypothetical protein AERO_16350 [Aeromicrobium fastidiosum]|uniref:hypothetical protein n=1 Tax=Aeromicrobium fastidiosum TaxID=52699 RepID=UPI0020238384|nr:hypothetical protein [Aeromicrobium fastidiosum]MCL8252961.1 hypothetical protein [Aeromicrobium fastidiosum]
MPQPLVRRVAHGVEMLPATARIAVRRGRRRGRSDRRATATWTSTGPRGTVEVTPPRSAVLVDGVAVGRLTCRVDAGTSTAECSSQVPDEMASDVVDLVVAGVRADVRRVAWFVPVDDTALEAALATSGFVCEGWAAPPLGDVREHRQWALLT